MELIPGSPQEKLLLNWWPAPRRNAAWDRCSNQIPWKPRPPWRYRKREAGLSAAWHRSKRTRQDLQMECWKHVSSPSGDHQQGMWHWDFFLEINLDSEVCCAWDRRLFKVSLTKNLGAIPAAQPSYPTIPHPQHGSSTELPCLTCPVP